MDIESLSLLRERLRAMTDKELAELAIQHNIPHAASTEYGDYTFLRQKVIAKLLRIELGNQSA